MKQVNRRIPNKTENNHIANLANNIKLFHFIRANNRVKNKNLNHKINNADIKQIEILTSPIPKYEVNNGYLNNFEYHNHFKWHNHLIRKEIFDINNFPLNLENKNKNNLLLISEIRMKISIQCIHFSFGLDTVYNKEYEKDDTILLEIINQELDKK